MSNSLTSNGPAVQSSQPTTFVERGVAVPFTTPKLSTARVRSSTRDGFDLITPNPSGGRGHYIVPWGSLRSLYIPTVFDTRLMARFSDIEAFSPAAIRQVVLEVAREGAAGRAAAAAATAALAAEARGRAATNVALLRRLVQEVEGAESAASLATCQPAEWQRRAQRALTILATRLRIDSTTIMATVEALARPFGPIGLADRCLTARLPALMAALAQIRQDLSALDLGKETGGLPVSLAVLLDATLAHAQITLAAARSQAANLVELIIAWRADPASTCAKLARTEWLLDGWERVCRVWFAAPGLPERLEALQNAILLIPVIPQEVASWSGLASGEHPILTPRGMVEHEDWRTGVGLLDVIARNEALLNHA